MGRKLNLEENEKEIKNEVEANEENESLQNEDGERTLFSFSTNDDEYWKRRVERLKEEKDFWDKEKEREEKEKREKRERRKVWGEFIAAVVMVSAISAAVFWVTNDILPIKSNQPQSFSDLSGSTGFTKEESVEPLTWDRNKPEIWLAAAILSGAGAIGLMITGRNKK